MKRIDPTIGPRAGLYAHFRAFRQPSFTLGSPVPLDVPALNDGLRQQRERCEALAASGELWTMAKQARKCHDIAGLRLYSPQDATDAVADRGGCLAGGAGLRVARRGDRGRRGF